MNWNDKTAANVRAIKPSGIRKFFDIAAQVEGVLSLSIGEPDFAAPDKVIDAMKASLDAKETSYTGNSGMMELRETISETFEKRYGVKYDPKDEILVTVGVSEGLAMALLAMTEPGDEVLIPDPAYVAYPAAVELAGGKAVFVPTYPEDDFKLSVAALEKVVTPKTKALVIGYPNNPTGTVMTAEELMPIAEFVKKHDLIVMADEIYCELMYGDAKFTTFAKLPDMRERDHRIQRFLQSPCHDRYASRLYLRTSRWLSSDFETPPVRYHVCQHDGSVRWDYGPQGLR